MTFNNGTGITDHIDMLDKLIEVVTSRFLESVVVNAGGTGHAIGDIIDIDATGATSTEVAQLEVTSVSGGVIDGIRVFRGGAYTVDPTTTTANAQSGTSGSGINSTFDLTMSAPVWIQNRRTQQAVSATIANGGSGYAVNDILSVTLGDGVQGDIDTTGTTGTTATFTVDTVSSGVVTAVSVLAVGNYEETPTNPAATTNDGSGDDACTLTITYEDGTFAENEFQVAMLQGEGLGGTDEIHVMIKTYSLVIGFDTAYNWALLGSTGYTSSLPIHQQLGVNNSGTDLQIDSSDGGLPAGDVGAYLVLKNNDADPDMEWWINHNGRRIIMVVKVEGSSTVQYSSMHLGFLNQLATDEEYPYPLMVGSGTSDKNRLWTESVLLSGGIVESIQAGSSDPTGPLFLRYPDGVWTPHCAEGSTTGTQRTIETEWGVYPFLFYDDLNAPKQLVDDTGLVGYTWGTRPIIPVSGVPGTETVLWKATTGSGADRFRLIAPIMIRAELNLAPGNYNMFGEIDGVFHFNRGGVGIVSEDRFVLDAARHTIFQNGNRTQNWSYFALDED